MKKFPSTLTAAAALCAFSAASHAQTVLKASHQFPGGKGDARDEMVQIVAKEAKAANVGLDVQVYPGASLFKPNDQWNAMVNGQLDISSFPLDYASGKIGAFSATLMPALVRNHDRATRLNGSPFMKDIKAKIDKAGVVVLADAWLAGAVASKRAASASPRTSRASRSVPPAPLSRLCGSRPALRLSRYRAMRSTTRCRPAWPTPPTPAPAASSPSASTSR